MCLVWFVCSPVNVFIVGGGGGGAIFCGEHGHGCLVFIYIPVNLFIVWGSGGHYEIVVCLM